MQRCIVQAEGKGRSQTAIDEPIGQCLALVVRGSTRKPAALAEDRHAGIFKGGYEPTAVEHIATRIMLDEFLRPIAGDLVVGKSDAVPSRKTRHQKVLEIRLRRRAE